MKTVNIWDLPDTQMVPDGWNMKEVPALTQENFEYLIKQHNLLVEKVNELCGEDES